MKPFPPSGAEQKYVLRLSPSEWTLLTALSVVYIGGFYWFLENPYWLGQQRPTLRALLLLALGIPAFTLGIFAFYLYWLPNKAVEGFSLRELERSLIADGTPASLVEIGVAVPIFAPRLTLRNDGLYSREIDVYLRLTDRAGRDTLHQALTEEASAAGVSVASAVRGMLRSDDSYLFTPLRIAPQRRANGQLVFVMGGIGEGISFDEALRQAAAAQYELRDAASGELLLASPFPLAAGN